MVTTCPMESDPRSNVAEFVKDRSVRSIAGFRRNGLLPLVEVVIEEIKKQYPDTELIVIDREIAADNKLIFFKDLEKYVRSKIVPGKRNDIMVFDDISINEWQNSFIFIQNENIPNIQVYFASIACRQTPACYKLL